jgi:hypothetical protein
MSRLGFSACIQSGGAADFEQAFEEAPCLLPGA